ncbi:ATP-binding cassette domain-containing protein [Chitinophaga varians]|uniref:ATP-binding cassette domain-containing protein n=1 Tax=Chitinophaga varians TaxID=2202339 RepID=A0A847RW75_9BACT|nr:ATP-binding cassette domain-containing protein [Chitinophaga varians]NLR67262.1 ATP-binding cassette domain-containing protein [Chitinophaga varians]
MAYCIEVAGLAYQFRDKTPVLQDIQLKVPQGAIYGFLGPNGAGKTTTLRLITGLLRMQTGNVQVLGKSFRQHRLEILRQTGCLIESPAIYEHLSAADNLLVLQRIYQCPKANIMEALNTVGLQAVRDKKAGQFSLGMKQRLALAMALLHHPRLLILDEPTNGLDPNGIIEMRELLKKINREQGISILISSHLLPEIEKLATHIGIISKGRMVFEGSLEQLSGLRRQVRGYLLETTDNAVAAKLLSARDIPIVTDTEGIQLPALPVAVITELNSQLVQRGIGVYGIQPVKNDLETIFMDLIQP